MVDTLTLQNTALRNTIYVLSWTNECVNAFKKWNDHYARHHSETLRVNGNDKTTIVLFHDLGIIAYRTPPGCLYSNAESLKAVKWETKQIKTTDENDNTKTKQLQKCI